MPDSNIVAPCCAACPAFTDVPGYVGLIALGRFAEAYDVARLTNPFANSCGYVCFHPCEQNCRRGGVDEAVSIMELKRASATYGGEESKEQRADSRKHGSSPLRGEGGGEGAKSVLGQPRKRSAVSKKIAVIGAGPAGLTAAQDLVSQGHEVTVFEREPKAGGMLRLTIPNYRLPDEALDRDIELIAKYGVKIEYGQELGKNLNLGELTKTFGSVVVATGLPLSRSLPVFPATGEILLALPFLKAVKEGNPPPLKELVIVVGGGNVAIDVARSAVRLGSRVELVCLESREEMPAHDWEIEEAVAEGVKMNCCLGPAEVLSQGAAVGGLKCQAVASIFDADGRFNPTFSDNEFAEIIGETIIVAIGQSRDTFMLQGTKVEASNLEEDGIFTAGEFAEGPGSAIQAVQGGHIAAGKALAYLSGELSQSAQSPSRAGSRELAEPEALPELTERIKPLVVKRDRMRAEARKPAERKKDFGLFEPGLSETSAVREALRCMACLSGATVEKEKCIACLTCVRVCPFEIPKIGAENVAEIEPVECQACGQCVTECPASAIKLNHGQEERLLADIEAAAKTSKTIEFMCLNSLRDNDPVTAKSRVPVPCAAQISELTILKALEAGAAKVSVVLCRDSECFYGDARERLFARIDTVKTTLSGLGLNPDMVEVKENPTK